MHHAMRGAWAHGGPLLFSGYWGFLSARGSHSSLLAVAHMFGMRAECPAPLPNATAAASRTCEFALAIASRIAPSTRDDVRVGWKLWWFQPQSPQLSNQIHRVTMGVGRLGDATER